MPALSVSSTVLAHKNLQVVYLHFVPDLSQGHAADVVLQLLTLQMSTATTNEHFAVSEILKF